MSLSLRVSHHVSRKQTMRLLLLVGTLNSLLGCAAPHVYDAQNYCQNFCDENMTPHLMEEKIFQLANTRARALTIGHDFRSPTTSPMITDH